VFISASRLIADFQMDTKYSVRSYLHSPQLVLVSILSLGLAVGVNTTIFSLVRALVGKPATAADPERLVRMKFGPGATQIQVSYPDYEEIRRENAFADLAAFADFSANWRLGEDARTLETLGVTANFFDLLGSRPEYGRFFTATEAKQDPQIAVISYQLWRRSGSDSNVIGRQATINGKSYVIIGVLPPNFRSVTTLAIAPDLYLPLCPVVDSKLNERTESRLNLLGRLRPGESAMAAQAALTPIAQYLKRTYPSEDRNFSVAETVPLSMSTGNSVAMRVADQTSASTLQGEPMWVGPDYFSTRGIPVLAGREFGKNDKPGSPEVALLNRTLAKRMFPGIDAVGRRIAILEGQKEQIIEIVGIVQDSKYSTLGESPRSALFLPFLQIAQPGQSLNLFVRTSGKPEFFRAEIQRAMRQLDPASFVQITRMRENLATVLLPNQITTALLSLIGLLAAALALAGVYGIVDYSVSRRTSEIGLRMAVGANRCRILALILGDTLWAIGPGAFFWFTRGLGVDEAGRNSLGIRGSCR
jgi:hypothetical protein